MLVAVPMARAVILRQAPCPPHPQVGTRDELAVSASDDVLWHHIHSRQAVQQPQNCLPRRFGPPVGEQDRLTQGANAAAARDDRRREITARQVTHVERAVNRNHQVDQREVLCQFSDNPGRRGDPQVADLPPMRLRNLAAAHKDTAPIQMWCEPIGAGDDR